MSNAERDGKPRRELIEEVNRLRRRNAELEHLVASGRRESAQFQLPDRDPESLEELLQHSEPGYRLLFERNPDGVFAVDTTGRFLLANPACEAISGYSVSELLQKRFMELCAPDHLAATVAHFKSNFVDPAHLQFETALVRKDGRRVELWVAGEPIFSGGKLVAVHCTAKDITDRKRNEEILRQSEQRFRVAQELSPDGFTIFRPVRDEQGRVVDFTWIYENATIARLNGTDPAAVVGRRLLDVLPSHAETPFHKAYQQVAESGKSCVLEAPFHGETMAEEKWFRVAAVPSGEDIAILAQDITERKRTEEMLRNSQRGYAAIFERSIVGKAEADLASGRFTRVNKALADLTGYSTEELSRMSFTDLTHPEDREREFELFEPIRAGREHSWQIEKRCIRKDGTAIWLNVAGNVINYDDGRPPRSVAVIQDITDRKRAEAELRESEERLQEALRVSHSFAFEWDPATDRVRRSQSCQPLLGLSGDETTSDTAPRYFQRVHPEDRDRFIAVLRDLSPASNRYDTKYRINRPDGSVTVVEESAQAFFGPDGRLSRLVGVTTDVTAREHALEALRQSEARYRILHESLRDAFVQVTMDGRIQECNDIYCEMLGYSPDEIRTLTHQELTPERWHEAEEKIVKDQIIARGYSDVYEKEYRRKDGTIIPVELRTILSRDAAGQPSAMWSIIREITERKKAEDALRRSEDLLRAVTDNSPDAIYVKDRESRWLMANPAVLRIVGRTAEEAIGKTDLELYSDIRVGSAIIQNDRRILDRGEPEAFEEIADTPEGRRVFLSIKAPRRDPKGNIIGIIGISRDMTEHKRAEQALRESELRFRLALRNAPVSVAVQDRDLRYIWAYNPGSAQREDMIGKVDTDIFTREEAAHLREMKKRVLDEGVELHEQLWFDRPGGRIFLDVCFEPIHDEHGNVVGVGSATVDLTPLKTAEVVQQALLQEREKLLESERSARGELEKANRLKDEFLANLSHELRTPLNAILGWTQLLRKNQSDRITMAKAVEVIERNTRVQSQLVSDLLDVSRIVSGKLRLDAENCNPVLALEAAIDSLSHAAEARKITIEKLIEPAAGPVLGDISRLQQTFWNLLSNAIKFTPPGGHVQIVLRRSDSHIEIVFRDTGKGIHPDFLPHIFERFRQADSSTSKSHAGLGLGLAIVKHLVELHGGTVRAESPGEGLGAAFTVELPLLAVDTQNRPTDPTALVNVGIGDIALNGIKVLVVDDEADTREVVKRLLEERGAAVATSESAQDGINLVQEYRPDVLVADIGMPGVDGYEMIRKIRQLGPGQGASTPAIALTAYSRAEDRTRALLAGYQYHLGKPVEAFELVATVATVARRLPGSC